MNTGKIITDLGYQRGGSQSDFATKIDISSAMNGKYEKNEALLSIEVAIKIAHTIQKCLDYIGMNTIFDKKEVWHIQIESLNPVIKKKLLFFINTLFRDTKAQKAYAQ